MRRLYLVLIAVGILLFLAVSVLLGRAFSVDGAERSAITDLVKSEARGDLAGVVAQITGCGRSAACRARVAANVAALQRPGSVSILQLQTSNGFSLTGSTGTARVAWKTGASLPIVQCVRVRRAGDVITQWRIELLELSARIKSDADCPGRF
ncbi:MAG TPA: hypothetical protein VMU39_27120 [Solirubrobacteraceae bacterium]|nr:hypothetical protein [Solirubrobacteraceae bacterium]